MNFQRKDLNLESLKQCLLNPNRYFCLSFDDSFKEHLWVAKDLVKSYNIDKKSMLFAINVGNSIYHNFSGMDIIYHLAQFKKLNEAF